MLVIGAFLLTLIDPTPSAQGEPVPLTHSANWRVIDGDTYQDMNTGERVRLENIDTPETGPRARCTAERNLGNRATQQARSFITNARQPKSLDAEQRNKRYLISMAVRVACFLGGVAAPTPWNWVLFAGAAVIPPIAVMLANAVDLRRPQENADDVTPARPELEVDTVIRGTVED